MSDSSDSSGTTTISNDIISYFGFEIGLFTVAAIFSSFFILKRLRGDIRNLEFFFAQKKWQFLDSDSNFVRYSKLLSYIVLVLMVIPFVSLTLWAIMVLVVSDEYGIPNVAGGSIFLIGFAMIFFALALLYIKWSYFKMKLVSIIFISLAVLLYLTFQLYAILETDKPSFLGLSAVFLSINGIIMVLIGVMSYSNNKGSIMDILEKLAQSTNKEDAIDTKYNNLPVEEQFEKLLGDPDYEVTEKEILKYVTIISSRKDFERSILSGGLQTIFRKKSVWFKRITLAILYLFSVAILVVYAVLCNSRLSEKELGYVTLIAVITTDIIIYFISHLDITYGQTTLTLLIIGMRCFLFGFGGTYWFLGYCSLYLLLTVVIGWKMVEGFYPLQIDFSKEKSILPLYKRIIKMPIFSYAIINIVFIIVTAVISADDDLDIPRGVFSIYGKEYETWVFGVACILISLTALACMATIRLHMRMGKAIKDKLKFPFIKAEFSTYLIFVYATYLFAILCGILWYLVVDDLFVLLTALVIPPVMLALYILHINFKKNDYRILADIKDQNIKVKAFLEAQATAKQLKVQQTMKVANPKEEVIETIELKEAVQQKNEKENDGGFSDYLNFSSISAKNKKVVIQEDWREAGMNFFSAFYKRKLLASDYYNIFTILFVLVALITYAVVIYGCTDTYRLRGFTVAVTIFVLSTVFLPMEGYFGTLTPPNWIQIVLLCLGFAGNYTYAACITKYQSGTEKENGDVLFTMIYWFFFLPMLNCAAIGAYDFWQNKGKKSWLTIIMAASLGVHLIGLGILFAFFEVWAAAIVCWGLILFTLIAMGVYHIYVKNNRSWPRRTVQWSIITGALIISAVFIASLCMDSFNDFVGFSLTYLALLLCLVVFVVKQFLSDLAHKSTHPVFYSPWVFPVYKYDPNLNSLKKNSSQGYMAFGVIFLLWFWTLAVVIWVQPVSLGVSLGCLCEVVAAVYFVYITTDSNNMLANAMIREDLFPKVVKKAWLQARNTYLTSKNVTKASDLMTYAEFEKEAQILRKFIEETKSKVQGNVKKVNPTTDPENLKRIPESQELKEMYAKLLEKLTTANGAFKDEVRLLIHFELLISLSIAQAVTKEKMTLLTFISQKKTELEANGLKFAFAPENLSVDAKYKLVMERYNCLSVEQQKTFDTIKASFLEQVKQDKAGASEKMKLEEEAKKQRQEALSKKLEEKKKFAQGDAANVKDMPDSVQKYERIIKEYEASKKKYEDSGFPAGPNSLGTSMTSLVGKWERAHDFSLTGDGIMGTDPRQGAIGDCYFVSALSVAGKQNIEKALLADEVKQRPEVGAYIVRFFFMGEPVEVIVDDLFPKDAGGNDWAFCKSDNGKKLWPMLFEKAYAKLHGGYQRIAAGKVSYALSELTGGYPEEIKLSTAQKNIDSFWEKIVKYKDNGYLLGAGSPENPQGDAAISSEGIIQGHAYAILDLKDFEGEKLLQLRNPHGLGGAEWRGDWSDASIKWTEKAKKVLKPEIKEDGVFWMSIQDFVYEFKSFYVCRIFDQKLWKKIPTIEGEWVGESAAGLPNKKNPSADLSKNPHYGIKVQRRCQIFIALTQEDRIDMFRGKLPIMFMVQKNGGKRITSSSLDLLAGNSGAPTDLITVSGEITLDVPTYPYTFSLMVATGVSGEEGQGKYRLEIQCTDTCSIVELK